MNLVSSIELNALLINKHNNPGYSITSFCCVQPVIFGNRNLRNGNVSSSFCFPNDVVLLIKVNKRTIRVSVRSYLLENKASKSSPRKIILVVRFN